MKAKVMAIVAVVVVIAVAAAYVATRPAPTPTPTLKPVFKTGMATDTAVEEPWYNILHIALTSAKKDLEKELGVEIVYELADKVAIVDAPRLYKDWGERGFDLIWAHGWQWGDAINAVGKDYPKTKFMYGQGFELSLGNVGIYDMYIEGGSYLIGVMAGMMTKTNKIGIVQAFGVDTEKRVANAIQMGAEKVNPNIKVVVVYTQSWYDPPKEKESAISLIDAGADMIYAGQGLGAIEGAKTKGVYAFGSVQDLYTLAPNTVLTSNLWVLDPLVRDTIKTIIKGTWTAKNFIYGMKEGGNVLAPYRELEKAIPQEVKDKVEKLKADIIAGTLVIPLIPPPPTGE